MRNKAKVQVTIAAGASLSSAANLGDKILCAILIPAAWTAAAITFQVSDDGGLTWFELYDAAGNEETVLAANVPAGGRIYLDSSDFGSVDFVKIRSGTLAAPVNQISAVTLTLVGRKFYALD